METLLRVLCSAIVLTVCAFSAALACDRPSHEQTWIKYGESRLAAKPITKIRSGSKWVFMLHPDPNDEETDTGLIEYNDVLVTITSKSPEHKWLSVSGRHVVSEKLEVCIPDGLEDGKVIEFTISVQWAGTLDPRGVIEN